MEVKPKTVLLIYSGGTIGMKKDAKTKKLEPYPDFKTIIKAFPEFLKEVDSSNQEDTTLKQKTVALSDQEDTNLEKKTVTLSDQEDTTQKQKTVALSDQEDTTQKQKTDDVGGSFEFMLNDIQVKFVIVNTGKLYDSCNMAYKEWNEIAGLIFQGYTTYDGFVVLHGTDTMIYGASALSFLCENLGKPIVFTGSQIPMIEPRNDGFNNLISSITVAATCTDLHEVALCFNNKVYRGNRCVKRDCDGFDAFESPNYPPLITLGTTITKHYISRSLKIQGSFEIPDSDYPMNENVELIIVYPGMKELNFTGNCKGVVLMAYGTGTVPKEILDKIKNTTVPIVTITQCQKGSVSDIYATSVGEGENIILGNDMTPSAALMKLSYLLGFYKDDIDTVKTKMVENLRGELTSSEPNPDIQSTVNSIIEKIDALKTEIGEKCDALKQMLNQSLN